MACAHIACLAAALLVACNRPAERSETPAGEPPGSQAARAANPGADAMSQRLKTPEPERTFVDGPPIEPPAGLLAWLDKTGAAEPRQRIRLPVVVRFADGHRIGLDGGHIGVSPAITPGAIQVALDDSAMGISLLDRVRQACPDEKQTECAVWLEGTWLGGPRRLFQVTRLVGVNPPAPPAGGAPIHALVEADAR